MFVCVPEYVCVYICMRVHKRVLARMYMLFFFFVGVGMFLGHGGGTHGYFSLVDLNLLLSTAMIHSVWKSRHGNLNPELGVLTSNEYPECPASF